MNETLIEFGDSVKAMPNGVVEGYLVRFSTQNDPDITRKKDFFTAATNYDLKRSTAATLYYDHGLDPKLGQREIGLGEMKMDDVGVWISAQLNLRDEYEAAIYKMAQDGKLGWSSGTASHLVKREKKSNGAHEIIKWPLGLDASLTPTPAEPRAQALAIKSAVLTLADYVKTKGEEMPEPNQPDIKGLFADSLAECLSPWMMQDALQCSLRKIQEAVEGANGVGAGVDSVSLVDGVLAEYTAKLRTWALNFVNQETEDGEHGVAYLSVTTNSLKAAGQSLDSLKRSLENELPIEDHTQAVEAAVGEFAKSAQSLGQIVDSLGERWNARASSRIKAGRKISGSNRDKMTKACNKLKACGEIMAMVHDDLQKLGVDEPEAKNAPDVLQEKPSAEELKALESQFVALQLKHLV